MANTVKPIYPDVPSYPGVPGLPRSGLSTNQRAIVSFGLGELFQFVFAPPRWGIFNDDPTDDTPLVEPDSILALEFNNTSNVSTFPVQNGSFAAYNKVPNPFEITVRMTKSGGILNTAGLIGRVGDLINNPSLDTLRGQTGRTEFIEALDKASRSIDLYRIETPEKTYSSCNITGINYRRETSQGAYMIIADVTFVEIRQVQANTMTVNAEGYNPAEDDPSAASVVNQGKQQASEVKPSLYERAKSKLSGLFS